MPAASTYIEFAASIWNMYGLQLAPRSASELQPVLMNTAFSRFATWPMARPEADEISPMIIATLSRSIRRSALAEAVCGLTESSMTRSILRPSTPPAALISSCAELDAHDAVFAERPEEAGERRQVADADGVALRAQDGRHADAGEQGGTAGALDQRAAGEVGNAHDNLPPCVMLAARARRLVAVGFGDYGRATAIQCPEGNAWNSAFKVCACW